MVEPDKEKKVIPCYLGLFFDQSHAIGSLECSSSVSGVAAVVFQGLGDLVIVYLNYILVFSLTLEYHLQNFDTIFDGLQKHDLKLKLKKCNF